MARQLAFALPLLAAGLSLRKDAPGSIGAAPSVAGGAEGAGSAEGAIGGTYGGVGAGTGSTGSYSEAGEVSAAADRAAGLISSLSSGAVGGAGADVGALTASSGSASSDSRVKNIERELIAGAESFDKASSMGDTAEQQELKKALRAAMKSSPTTVGRMPAPGSSAGVTSFLRSVSGKISLSQMATIASSVAASAAKHVASGRANSQCDRCTPNFAACPLSWDTSRAGECLPPPSYAGYCNKAFSPSEFSPAQLEEAEVFCSFCMPCAV
mmetsp:Transcript_19503/g.48927  ORF Transcript_19503/g.48927 Transcript_19503/m.48927 type:complete len:269 (+) Transcript_19503:108-914(+)